MERYVEGITAMRCFRLTTACILGLALVLLLGVWRPAAAVPSFAGQTGQPCTACHVGAFGPQLTPFGRVFKIGGYTLTGGEGLASKVPLSAFLLGSFTHTNEAQPGPAAQHFGDNNNFALDQISLFYAGRITDWAGAFVQTTYNGVNAASSDPANPTFKLDNTDIRFTKAVTLGGSSLQLGITANNGPTVQDPYNTSFAWGIPYVQSVLAPVPSAQPILAGALIGNSLGITGYGWYDNALYVEAGAYQTYDATISKKLGVCCNSVGTTQAPAPYGRLAYEWNWNNQSAHVGLITLYTELNPAAGSPGFGSDNYLDTALDGSWQWIGDETNVVTLQGVIVHEKQDLGSSFAQGLADRKNQTLDQLRANVSYFYKQTYGATFGIQKTWGNSDLAFYGTQNGSPNTLAFLTQLDYIPFGKEGSWKSPWANLKVGIQYIAYTQFDGSSTNYDGTNRKASANNTLYAYAWIAF